jgi:hypothetical protein
VSQVCPECGAAVAEDQRYCVRCGAGLRPRPPTTEAEPEPRAPQPPRPLVLKLCLRGRTGIVRLPNQRLSAVLAAGMLASGVLIGIAVGPVALGSSAADAARRIIALVGGPSSAPKSVAATTSPTSSDSGGGGGVGSLLSGPGSTTAPAAQAPASTPPATASPAAAATTTTSTTSTNATSTTTAPAKLNASGVVIASDFAAQSFDIVDPKHRLVEVHAASIPSVGTRVKFARTVLANGTDSASRSVTVRGARPSTVTVNGDVSFVNTANASYVLSAPGVSLPIDTALTPAPTTLPTTTTPAATTTTPTATTTPAATTIPSPSATPAPLPSVGQRLEVILSLPAATATGAAATSLKEVSHNVSGQPSGPLDLAGVITAIDRQKRIVTVSADGPGLGSDTVPLSVPPSISLHGLRPPATVVAQVSFTTGVYSLSWLAPDDSATAAADRTKFLGRFRPSARASRGRTRSPSLRGRGRAQGSGA